MISYTKYTMRDQICQLSNKVRTQPEDAVRGKGGFCDEYATGVNWKMPVNYCCHPSLRPTPARRVAEKLAPSVFVSLRRDKSLRWAQGKIRSAPTGGWIAEEGRVRVRNRSELENTSKPCSSNSCPQRSEGAVTSKRHVCRPQVRFFTKIETIVFRRSA